MLKAQRDRGKIGHRIIAIGDEFEGYISVLHRLVHEVGPFLVPCPWKTEADRSDIDGGIELISQEYCIEYTDGGSKRVASDDDVCCIKFGDTGLNGGEYVLRGAFEAASQRIMSWSYDHAR
jgi:hypothetical protein